MSDEHSNSGETSVAGSSGEVLRKRISVIHKYPITHKGNKGFFVTHKSLTTMESHLDSLIEEGSVSPTALIELNDQLTELRQAKLIADEALASAKADLAAKQEKLTKSVNTSKEWKVYSDNLVKQHEVKIKGHLQDISEANASVKTFKDLYEKAKHGFDPDVAIKTKEDYDASKVALAKLRSALDDTKSARSTLEKENKQKADEIKSMQAALDVAKAETDRLRTLHTLAGSDYRFDLEPVTVKIESNIVKTIIGDKGLKWLQSAVDSQRNDLRERSYNLMNAAKSGHTHLIRSIGDLLQVLFKWLKAQSYKARERVRTWVDMIEKDLATMSLRSLKFYRESLEKLIEVSGKTGKQIAKVHKEYKEKHSWYKTILERFQKLTLNVSPALSIVKKPFTWISNQVTSIYSATRDRYNLAVFNRYRKQHVNGSHQTYNAKCPSCVKDKFPALYEQSYAKRATRWPGAFPDPEGTVVPPEIAPEPVKIDKGKKPERETVFPG